MASPRRANDVKFRVRLSAKAENDVDDVLRWFADQQAEVAAARWLAQLWAKIETLETMPARCSLAAEAADLKIELRELLFGRRNAKYRILFVIERSQVHILHIRRASRDTVSPGDL